MKKAAIISLTIAALVFGCAVGTCVPNQKMKCIICKKGNTQPGRVTFTVDKGSTVVVIRDVPAQVCSTCGEEYIDAATMKDIEKRVDSAQKAGVNIAPAV